MVNQMVRVDLAFVASSALPQLIGTRHGSVALWCSLALLVLWRRHDLAMVVWVMRRGCAWLGLA
jgi:hypothetical protein